MVYKRVKVAWVHFKDKKPPLGVPFITRGIFRDRRGNSFEDWKQFEDYILRIKPPVTHWWDGEFDLEKAVEAWFDGK